MKKLDKFFITTTWRESKFLVRDSLPFSCDISLKTAELPLSRVGRTVPSFRIAAEIERTKWTQFRSNLDKKDRKMFDQMYDYVKLNNAGL